MPRPAIARQVDAVEADGEVAFAEKKAAQAFEAYQAKRFAEAVALYIEAYDAAPNADILLNVARIYDSKLGDRPLAINFYRRYIADPGAAADRVQLANERLTALREAEFAAAPLAPRAGPRAGAEASEGPRAPARPAEPGWTAPEVFGVIMGATGIVAIGVGAGFGVAAVNETNTARDLCEGNLCREQRGIDAADSAKDHAMVSTIGFASGGALLAIGAALYFWIGGEPSEKQEQASGAGLQLDAHLSRDSGDWSLELGGSW